MAPTAKNNIRRKILDVTRNLLIEHGINHLSIRMISKKVGCSVGTIYVYFENKDVLIHSLIEEGFELLNELQEKALAAISDPVEQLQSLARTYIGFGMNNPGYYEIMFMLKPERMARYPAEKYRRARRTITIISDTLTEATKAGLMQVNESYLSAHLFWSFMHGVVSLIQVKRIDRSISDNNMIEAAVQQIVNMNLNSTG